MKLTRSGHHRQDSAPARPLHLCLGAGGARALAHIGVLKVMEDQQFPVVRLSGSSGGAIIAALYAQTGSTQAMLDRINKFLCCDRLKKFGLELFAEKHNNHHGYVESLKNFLHHLKSHLVYFEGLIKPSFFPAERLIGLLTELLEDGNIEHTRIPLQIAAVNLDTGEEVVLDHGNIIQAVAASSAIPGVFLPVEIEGMRLIDGAVLNDVPLMRVSTYQEVVVGVDVTPPLHTMYPKQQVALDYIWRADAISAHKLHELHVQKAEILICPEAARHGHWADFQHVDEYIQSGEQAALEKISDMKRAMNHTDSQVKRWLRQKICENVIS